jgi:hypothetical protein
MMRIVDLDDHVGDRELKLVCPQTAGFVRRRQIMARAKKHEDVRCLADDQIAGLQEGRRKRGAVCGTAV